MLHAVIMAGGSGTRFWPASRARRPKQLLNLLGQQSLLQATVRRLGDLVPAERVRILTNRQLVPAILEQLPELDPAALLGEPCKRDTAACIGLAAALIAQDDPAAVMLVMPADHVIAPESRFQAAVVEAASLVERQPQQLITFGIRPTYPAETFGYIERGGALAQRTECPAFHVQSFHEKPAADVAAEYLRAGNYYWNSGIFLWKAATILDALRQYEPAMFERLTAIAAAAATPHFETILEREFSAIAGKSIDFAVMEKYPEVTVLEAPFEWDDLGSWQSLPRRQGTDENDNTLLAKHLGIDTHGCIIRSEKDHLIVTLGLEDCIVVHTDDATLVARRDREESIRRVVAMLEERGWNEYL